MRNKIEIPCTLRIGKANYSVANLAEASRAYQLIRDTVERGDGPTHGFNQQRAVVETEGSRFRMSYNGAIWDGETCVQRPEFIQPLDVYSDRELTTFIAEWQDVQRKNAPGTMEWERASRELAPLFAEMALRQRRKLLSNI